VSDAFIRDWIWVLAFFPLWLVTSGTMFGLAHGPKRYMGLRGQKMTNAVTLFLSLSMAAASLMWLECESYVHLPFARPACGMLNTPIAVTAWL